MLKTDCGSRLCILLSRKPLNSLSTLTIKRSFRAFYARGINTNLILDMELDGGYFFEMQ